MRTPRLGEEYHISSDFWVGSRGAVIACWCYSEMQVAPEIDPILFRLDHEILHDDWLLEHFEVSRHYATLSEALEKGFVVVREAPAQGVANPEGPLPRLDKPRFQ